MQPTQTRYPTRHGDASSKRLQCPRDEEGTQNAQHTVFTGQAYSSPLFDTTYIVYLQKALFMISYLEVESDEGEYEAFEVLDEVVKDAKPFWVVALLYV